MGITQKEIARALNLPLITVHRALNSSGYVSKELKGRILAYAREVRYVPHKASQVLKRNKVRKIAVFSSSLPHYFWNDIRTGISIAAEQIQALNYRVNYHTIAERNSDQYLARLDEEIRDGVEAIAFVNQWIYSMDEIISRITLAGVPYVTLNVDAPESRRLCYVGPDYRAGGGLAAEYIGKTLLFKRRPCVLVLTTLPDSRVALKAPDINKLRYDGFREVIERHFPQCAHDTAFITKGMSSPAAARHIADLLAEREGNFDAIYLIAAYNGPFIKALEQSAYSRRVVVLHDLDSSSNHLLARNLLTAVIYQNPILQGYYTVRTLENLLESGHPPEVRLFNIVHSVILNENKDLYKNHTFFARMMGDGE
ncbi:MAG: substrate-binding domain-containing protein [Spirochaetia bacterium]|jgi:LacI family transcriptional regulator